jgi:hypothetical protein
MATVRGSDPVELRVLSALTSGASTAVGVAAQVGEPESVVEPILEWSVAEQRAVRLELPGLPTYALTQQGLALLDFSQDAQGVVDHTPGDHPSAVPDDAVAPGGQTEELLPPVAPIDEQLPPVAPTGIGPGTASGGTSVSTNPALPPQVRWRHVAYAAGYVLIGLVLLAFQPLVGVLAVIAGIVLGGYALRPLLATRRTRVNSR